MIHLRNIRINKRLSLNNHSLRKKGRFNKKSIFGLKRLSKIYECYQLNQSIRFYSNNIEESNSNNVLYLITFNFLLPYLNVNFDIHKLGH